MHIGILTFHAPHNFGSMLQNYALQQFLIAEGHSVETINLRNEKQKYMYNHPLHWGKSCPSYRALLGKFKDPKWLTLECKRWRLFEQFLKHNLNLTKEFKNWNEIKKELPNLQFDAIITGGDQIWNTFCYDFDWSYFLPDNIKPTRKIAFSASFGNEIERTREDEVRVAKIKKFLEDFDYISVREKDGSDYLRNLLDKNIPFTADPTILANPSIYSRFIKEPIIKEPYIYYYTPSHIPDLEAEKTAIELAERLNVHIVTSYPHFRSNNGMLRVSTGPIEFLNLIKNAKLVVGKSYHLLIFSILLHKDFVTIKSDKDQRMSTLLRQLGVPCRNINSVEDFNDLQQIDYDIVDYEISIFRNDAVSYLHRALSSN